MSATHTTNMDTLTTTDHVPAINVIRLDLESVYWDLGRYLMAGGVSQSEREGVVKARCLLILALSAIKPQHTQ